MADSYDEWDYDSDVVMTYERTGQCNRCGECCKAKTIFDVIGTDTAEWWTTTDGKGIWNEISFYGVRRFLKLKQNTPDGGRCPSLTCSNKCLPHLFAGEPPSVICETWPFSPKHIKPFPNCGFAFVEKECGAISERPND